MANLVEVKEEKKTKSRKKIDLGKVKKLIDDNPEAVAKIKEGVTDIITSKVIGKATKKSTSKKKTTKTTKKTSGDDLSKMLDLAGSLFKK